MLGIFAMNGLMDIKVKFRTTPAGKSYPVYTITNVRLDLPSALLNEENSDDKIEDILNKLMIKKDDIGVLF